MKAIWAVPVIVSILIFGVYTLDAFAHKTGPYRYDNESSSNPNPLNPNWMSTLSDDAKITELSLPGTHDSWAGHQSNYYNPQWSTRTQGMDLEEQLNAGIRALDIRVRCLLDNLADDYCTFTIHHGTVYLHKNFKKDTLEKVLDWLKSHPTEMVIMNLQKETHNVEESTEIITTTLKKLGYLNSHD